MENALILIDFINDIIAPEGKLSGKGYAEFAARHGTLLRVAELLEKTRQRDYAVIHVRIGFSPDYREQPKGSPLFGHAGKIGALMLCGWGTEFHKAAQPLQGESVLTKHRVSAFVGTPLDTLLRSAGVKRVAFAGCSTDVGVQTSVRAAHDLDYACIVIGDCCIAPSDEDHEQTLRMLAKVAQVMTLERFLAT